LLAQQIVKPYQFGKLETLMSDWMVRLETRKYDVRKSYMATNSQIAFNPQGKTVVVAAAGTAPTGVQAPVYEKFNPQATGQYRFVNAGSNTVFLGTGPTAALAQAAAVAPVAGTPSDAIVLVAGAVEILRFNKDTFFSGLAAAATTVYITPGEGI
jgi:hypothetical protein